MVVSDSHCYKQAAVVVYLLYPAFAAAATGAYMMPTIAGRLAG